MKPSLIVLLPLCASSFAAMSPAAALEQGDSGSAIEEVLIIAQRAERTSKGATGLNLSLAETPQSVTVLERDTLDAFGLDEINDVLRLTTGVNVESVETDRTYYNARGFDILSMQVDGVGIPFGELINGSLDTVLYDKVEVVRGANGLLTGSGNPSGTVNYVRKRPTNELAASGELTLGSWNRKRVEADLSTPLTASGEWAMRLVAAVEDKESYLNLYQHQRKVLYGVVDGQLGERTTVALGHTHQDSESDGVMWGALPLLYTDGTQADFDVSTTISQSWTYWDVHTDSSFAELAVQLSKDWSVKTSLVYNTENQPAEAFWTFDANYGATVDRNTGLGVYGWPGKFTEKNRALLSDTVLSGSFPLWGRRHDLTMGLSLAKENHDDYSWSEPNTDADPYYYVMPAFPGWVGNEVSRPAFANRQLAAEIDNRLNRLYGATRLEVTDALKVVLGFNALDAKATGYSWGTAANKEEQAVSPYLGATWRISNWNVYASYSDIFQPQSVVQPNLTPLGSAKGESYEAGAKSEWFNKQLMTSVALFKAEQSNLQEFAGYTGTDFIAYYEGIDVRSSGYELEMAGRPHDSLTVQAGYTHLKLEDPQGNDTRTYIPRDTFKLLATWQTPFVNGLELGASMRWQNDIYLDTGAGVLRQGTYAIYGVHASYEFADHFKLQAAIDNLANQKYLGSLQWNQAFYGEPRKVTAQLSWMY